jgi:hypothetical protein
MARERKKGAIVGDLLWMIAFVGIWLALQLWILPKLGVST